MNMKLGAIALAVVLTAPALAGDQDFEIVNKTGFPIHEVYVSDSDSEDWEEDVLDEDVLSNGESVTITFDGDADVCEFDLMAVYANGVEAIWPGLDLCEISEVTLYYDAGRRKTRATWR